MIEVPDFCPFQATTLTIQACQEGVWNYLALTVQGGVGWAVQLRIECVNKGHR